MMHVKARRLFHEYAGRIGPRRSLGSHRTLVAAAQASEEQCRKAPGSGSCLPARSGIPASHRLPVAISAMPGTRLRLISDRLATLRALDPSRGLAQAPPESGRLGSGDRRGRSPTRDHRHRFLSRCLWGAHTGPSSTDRAKNGCKRAVLTDIHGFPLLVFVTPANHRDDKHALAFIDQLRALPDAQGMLWHKPLIAQGDRGFGYCQVILPLMTRGILALIPLANDACHGSGLGKVRYVVERTLAWFGCFRRLGKCFERTGAHLTALHQFAAALICLKKVHCVVSHF